MRLETYTATYVHFLNWLFCEFEKIFFTSSIIIIISCHYSFFKKLNTKNAILCNYQSIKIQKKCLKLLGSTRKVTPIRKIYILVVKIGVAFSIGIHL